MSPLLTLGTPIDRPGEGYARQKGWDSEAEGARENELRD